VEEYEQRGIVMAFRLRVKEILREKDISISKFSRGADIPLGMARRMVNDPTYNPTGATLAKAAQFLGVSMDDLYYDDEKEGPKKE
jgi:transcriptional regulator with XRE-family HTH domain